MQIGIKGVSRYGRKIRKLSNSEIEVLAKIGIKLIADIYREKPTKWIEGNVEWCHAYGTKCNST